MKHLSLFPFLTIVYLLVAPTAFGDTAGILWQQTTGEGCPNNPAGQLVTATDPQRDYNDFFQTIFDDFSLEGDLTTKRNIVRCTIYLMVKPEDKRFLKIDVEGFVELPEQQKAVIKVKKGNVEKKGKQENLHMK